MVLLATLLVGAMALAGCSKSDAGSGKALPAEQLQVLTTGKAASWPTGKPLVINVWASWCAPCRKEMPAFQQVVDRLGSKVAIIGVTDEPNRTAARKAAATSGVRYPLYVDAGQKLQIDLDIASLPATIFVSADGKVLGRHVGAMTQDQLLAQIEDRYGVKP